MTGHLGGFCCHLQSRITVACGLPIRFIYLIYIWWKNIIKCESAVICSSAFMKDVWRNVRSTDTTWGLSIKLLLEVSQLCSLWVR